MNRPNLFGTIFTLVLVTLLVSQLIAAALLVVVRPPPPAAIGLTAIVNEIRAGDPAATGRLKHQDSSKPPEFDASDGESARRIAGRIAGALGVGRDAVVVDLARIQRGRLILIDTGNEAEPRTEVALVGEFRLSVRQPDGSWRHYSPQGEGVFETVEQRYLLLFLLGALLMLPPAWWLARRLARPFAQLADQAEQLGRDPSADTAPISGPQEAQRASRAVARMAQRLNLLVADRTQMVGALAHDLRTPLTRLAFRIDELPPAQRRGMAADIAEMEAMVSATLDYVVGTTARPRRTPVDLGMLLESACVDARIGGQEATLLAEPGLIVVGDSIALKRLFSNLFQNALRYGKSAHAVLRRDGMLAVVEIEDDGPGIPESEQALVFEPFYRGEKSRNRRTGGIGLGLAFARSVARAHGGEISIANRSPRGLRATVRLPLARDPADLASAAAPLEQGALHR